MNVVDNLDAEALRTCLAELLDTGLDTEWRQRAYSGEAILERVAKLQALAPTDYVTKFKVAGFTSHSYRPPEDTELEHSCATCMYFARHRQYCELPELALPVRPEWSCVLWRI